VFKKNGRELYELMAQPLDTENIKRLADVLSLWSAARVELDLPPMLRRIHAMKLYALAQAGRSAVSTGLEVIDDFLVLMADPDGARQTMEQNILPLVREFQLTDTLASVRSVYAVVLAWSGELADARREIAAVLEYGGTAAEKAELQKRANLIEAIAEGAVWLERQIPPPNALALIPGALKNAGRKIGRNTPCPCGSGLKYKRCHGRY
jgi:hypothetical protein